MSAKKAYAEKLKDPRWQKRRLEVLGRDEFTCQHCFDSESTLHVHHRAYGNGDPWDVPDCYLVTLCAECHEDHSKESWPAFKEFMAIFGICGGLSLHLDESITDPFRDYAFNVQRGTATQLNEPDFSVIGWHLRSLLESRASGGQAWDDVYHAYFENLRKRAKTAKKRLEQRKGVKACQE